MYWDVLGIGIFVCIYKRVITYAAYACRWFASPKTKKKNMIYVAICVYILIQSYTGPTSLLMSPARHHDNSDLFSCIKKQAGMFMEVSNWLVSWFITYLSDL